MSKCKVCGSDLGWDRPSGVCSEACLRKAQGFDAEPKIKDARDTRKQWGDFYRLAPQEHREAAAR